MSRMSQMSQMSRMSVICAAAVAAFALALMARSMSDAAAAQAGDATAPSTSVLGRGSGLNHVSVLVHDLPAMTALFQDRLGFNVQSWGRFPDGLENAGVAFSDRTYLEFLAIYDPRKAASSDEAAFLKEHEGADGFGLETDSVERALAVLRSRGVSAKISTTTGAGYSEPGRSASATWLWRDIDLPSDVAGGPFLVEYNRAERAARAKRDPVGEQKRALGRIHPNGAVRLASVWIAVEDLDAAVHRYQGLGLVPGRLLHLPELSASGREIAAGGGAILLLTPEPRSGGSGAVAEFLTRRGAGLMGVTIEVADMARARAYLESHAAGLLRTSLPPDQDVLISGDAVHGLWLRLHEARPGQARAAD